jgi:hypothetical protein
VTDDLIPVHLSVRDGRVSVLMLLDLPGGGMARYEGDVWKQIGYVHQYTQVHQNPISRLTVETKVWAWHYDEQEFDRAHGNATSKTKAVQAILAAGGYREVPDTATIPDLLEGL